MNLSLPSERYFEDAEEIELSPRNYGILMHRAFELSENEEEIHRAIENMIADGTLSDDEAAVLNAKIDTALTNPTVRDWFSGCWQRVRNEAQIIDSRQRSIVRPDRVMISGAKAVVVDYKFGKLTPAGHRNQIENYCRLLREMGYVDVAGYLWYVKRGDVERVV